MANYMDLSAVGGDLKNVYGSFQWLLPEDALCQQLWGFSAGDSVGNAYVEALQVTSSWSLTFCGSDGSVQDNVDGVASTVVQASVKPYLTVLEDKISYSSFDRAPDSGKKAFLSMSTFVGKNLAMQMRRCLEISMLTGQQGWATLDSYSPSGTGSVVISAASLRPGILAFLQGALVDVIRPGSPNQIIADGATANPSGGIKISQVDIDNRTLTFDALPYIGSSAATPAAGDILFLHGAAGKSTGNAATNVAYQEMVGLRMQASATSGTVFGLDKSQYLAIRGNNVTTLGAISAGALLKCATKAINRGFQGRMVAFLSPLSWSELNSRVISQQMFDQSYSVAKASEGSDAIEIRGQGVVLEVHAHPMQADGEALFLPKDDVKRVGSAYENSGPDGDTDLSFMIPGSNLRFIDPIPGKTAVRVQCRSDQQVYLAKPAFSVLATGVTHAA